jgi:hypothetical protein
VDTSQLQQLMCLHQLLLLRRPVYQDSLVLDMSLETSPLPSLRNLFSLVSVTQQDQWEAAQVSWENPVLLPLSLLPPRRPQFSLDSATQLARLQLPPKLPHPILLLCKYADKNFLFA